MVKRYGLRLGLPYLYNDKYAQSLVEKKTHCWGKAEAWYLFTKLGRKWETRLFQEQTIYIWHIISVHVTTNLTQYLYLSVYAVMWVCE